MTMLLALALLAAKPPTTDVCALLTPGEVQQALGAEGMKPAKAGRVEGGRHEAADRCVYAAVENEGTLTLVVHDDAALYPGKKSRLTSVQEPVQGVGVPAVRMDNLLSFVKNGHDVQVLVVRLTGDLAFPDDKLAALGKLVASRMKK